MSVDFIDTQAEMQKKQYNMKCKVIRKRVSYYDDAYEGNSHADLVLLEPFEGTERDMFMAAFYRDAAPVKNGEGHLASKVELPCFIGSPVSMPCYLRLQWPNEYFDRPHLQVMTVAIEHLLNTYKDKDTIEVRTFPYGSEDEIGLSPDGQVRS